MKGVIIKVGRLGIKLQDNRRTMFIFPKRQYLVRAAHANIKRDDEERCPGSSVLRRLGMVDYPVVLSFVSRFVALVHEEVVVLSFVRFPTHLPIVKLPAFLLDSEGGQLLTASDSL
eukprot:scaffold1150_cov152-Amphora_coffeaeformis.AAC.13